MDNNNINNNSAGPAIRPLHSIRAALTMATRRAKRRHATWKEQIIRALGEGNATMRMLAKQLDCQTSDISRAVRELRSREIIVDAGVGLDPHSNHKARYWALADPIIAEMVGEAI